VIEAPGFFWTVLFFLAAIGPLIFLHELGHYLVGRWCGVKADTFSIGFGREVFGWTDKRGTRWKIGWMPLGGYVKFAGDMSAASTPDLEWQSLPESEKSFVFQAKPVWKRALIVVAGPVTNFLVAAVIYMGLFAAIGEMASPPVAAVVQPGSAAAKAGFLSGDRVTAINGNQVERFTDMISYVALRPNQLLTVEIVRGGVAKSITVAPDEYELVSRFGTKTSIGRLGFAAPRAEPVPVALLDLPGAAIRQVVRVVGSMVDGLGQIIMGYHSVRELGGPMMIAKMSGEMATLGFVAFVEFMALISINLGFINLLPVPMLDGGHLFFYGLEALRRKPVALHVQEWAYRTGFMLLMGLMAFVTINDLGRFGLLKKLGGLIG
jgi:regulator of sigma E protease